MIKLIEEIIFIVEIRPVLRSGCRQYGESSHYEATGNYAGYPYICQERKWSVHHEVAGGCHQGYFRVHLHQDNNGRARNVDDPNYHATNATILFLPASSVDRFPCRNRFMRSQVSFIIMYICVASCKFAQTRRQLCWHILRDIDLYAIVLHLVHIDMQQCWYCNLLHHAILWVTMSIIKIKRY